MKPEPERLEILSTFAPAATPGFNLCTTYWVDDQPVVDELGRVTYRIRASVELVRAPAPEELHA